MNIVDEIPVEDIHAARELGYSYIRRIYDVADGKVIARRTQVRTGFTVNPPVDTWEDLQTVMAQAALKGDINGRD